MGARLVRLDTIVADAGQRMAAVGRQAADAHAWLRPAGSFVVGWPLAALLGAYIWLATATWNVPNPDALPFGILWAGVILAIASLWVSTGHRLRPLTAICIGAIAAMVLTDVSYLATQGMRDLHLYLRAGDRFLNGEAVYIDGLFTRRPADLSTYPFLYPPVTLPLFGLLARLPHELVEVAWLLGSGAAAVAALRWLGVRWRFVGVLLIWPPFFQGLQVGNVAVPLAALFALAPWFGAGLVLGAVFKVYSGLAALWLVRERRLGQLALGVVVVLLLAALSLPLTGVERWNEWLRGLDWFRASQILLPDYLFGFGLARYVSAVLAVIVAAALVAAAGVTPGRSGLARLGLATVVASPTLYAHGLLMALPAFLELRARWLWVVLAITSVAPGLGWWAAIGIGGAAWWMPALRRSTETDAIDAPDEELHPLPPGVVPWPAARFDDETLQTTL